ncbi:hypothetical protein BH09SUM1_BH09SUM1_13420 [soil metagenome]
MFESDAPAQRYDIKETSEAVDGVTVSLAEERSTGGPCYIHQIKVSDHFADADRQSAIATMKRFALIHAPRAPLVVDGWVADGVISAVEFKTMAPPLDLHAGNPFRTGQVKKADLFESTLNHIATLHRVNIVHGAIEPGIFGVSGQNGKVHLVDSSLSRQLKRCSEAAQSAEMFSLSENLSSKDVAQWAFCMTSMMKGDALLAETIADAWEDIEFKEAERKLKGLFGEGEATEFFLKCLHGFGRNVPPFESASDARRWWHAHNVGSRIK